jgi:hypothetical protein
VPEPARNDAANQTDYAGIDATLGGWWQGDTISGIPLTWSTDDEHPLTPEGVKVIALTSELPEDHFVSVEVLPERVAIVTQTCDLARSSDPAMGQPLAQVSPVVDLTDSPDLLNAQGGHTPHFAPLPALGNTMFADLRKCSTIEKSVLARVAATRVSGCDTDLHRAAFSRAVARQRGRFAFPDDFTAAFKRLQERLRRNRKKDTAEGRRIADVLQIRAGCRSGNWFDEEIQLDLVFLVRDLPPSGDDPEPLTAETTELLASSPTITNLAEYLDLYLRPVDQAAVWNALVGAWVSGCELNDTVTGLNASAESPDEYTIAQAWRMPRIDLDHLSDEATKHSDRLSPGSI